MQITVAANDIRGFVYSQTALLARAGKGEVECTPDNEDALEGLMDNVLTNTSKALRAGLWPTYEFSLDENDEENVVLDVPKIEAGAERSMRAKMQLQYAVAYGLLAEWLKPFGNESFSVYAVQQLALTNELVATLVSKPAEGAREIVARGDTERTDGDEDADTDATAARGDTERTDGDEDADTDATAARGDTERTDGDEDADTGATAARGDTERSDSDEDTETGATAARGDTERTDGDEENFGMRPALEDNIVADMRKVTREWLEERCGVLEIH